MDELRVEKEGDMWRRPLATDLLTVGEGRRREIRTHYYSWKGKWELSVCMSHCIMWGYSQGGRVNMLPSTRPPSSLLQSHGISPEKLDLQCHGDRYPSLTSASETLTFWTLLSRLFEASSILRWSAVNFEHTYSLVFVRQSIRGIVSFKYALRCT